MVTKTLSIVALIASVLALGLQFSLSEEIAFVRSNDLIYQFQGTLDAQESFMAENDVWEGNLDSLKQRYNQTLETYKLEYNSLSEDELASYRQVLESQRENVLRYEEIVVQKSGEKEALMLEGVLSEINQFVQQYAEEHGYTLVFGTTDDGSIVYGDKGNDITDQVLEELNKSYTSN